MAVKNGVITLSILRGSTELPWIELHLFLNRNRSGASSGKVITLGALSSSSSRRIARDIARTAPKFDWLADRKSTRLNSSHLGISYAVFCLKKKKDRHATTNKT